MDLAYADDIPKGRNGRQNIDKQERIKKRSRNRDTISLLIKKAPELCSVI